MITSEYILLCLAGVAASSILWGPWATGMAAADARLNARFAKAGLMTIGPALGLCLLSLTLQSGLSKLVAAPIMWERLLKAGAPPIFEAFAPPALPPPPTATEVRSHSYFLTSAASQQTFSADTLHREVCGMQVSREASRQVPEASMQARALWEVQETVAAMLGSSIPDDQVHALPHLLVLDLPCLPSCLIPPHFHRGPFTMGTRDPWP